MADLFKDGFESGTTNAWSAIIDTESDITVTEAAALHGTYGLNLLIDNATVMYIQDDTPNDEKRYRFRFYIDPNSLTMGNNEYFTIVDAIHLQIGLQFINGTGYRIRVSDRTDGSWAKTTGFWNISDEPHCIEVDWKASSAPLANDGFLELLIDGVSKITVTDIDSDTGNVAFIRLGNVGGIDAGTSGTFYLDDFASNNDGSLIGTMEEKSLSEAFSVADSLTKSVTKQLGETLSVVDSWLARINLSETLSIADSLIKNGIKQLGEAFSIADSKVTKILKALEEAFSIADGKVTKIRKSLGEAFSIVDSFAYTAILRFYEVLKIADSYITDLRWIGVTKGKVSWNKVDKNYMGWLVNGWLIYGWLIISWEKISKSISNFNKISKETSAWSEISKTKGEWDKVEKR